MRGIRRPRAGAWRQSRWRQSRKGDILCAVLVLSLVVCSFLCPLGLLSRRSKPQLLSIHLVGFEHEINSPDFAFYLGMPMQQAQL